MPSQWSLVPFKRLAALREDPDATASETLLSLKNTGELVARGEDVQPPSDEHRLRYWRVDPGDLVVNPMWLAGGAIGVSRVSGAVSPDYRVYCLSPQVEPRFIHHLFRSAPYHDQYRLLMRAETTFDRRVTKEDFGDLPVLLPPLHEQGAIAGILDAEMARIDALVEKKRLMAGLFEERRIAITDTAILQEEGPDRPVSALAAYVNGWPFAPDDFSQSGLPVIRIAQLTNPSLEPDLFDGDLPDRVRLRDGDLVFSWSASLEVRLWNRGDAYLNQHLYRVLPAPGIDRQWLRFALDTATRQFKAVMHGSAMTHITQPMMKLVRVPVPAQERQLQIARALDAQWSLIDRVVGRLSRQSDLLREHREALLTAAVTGQLETAEAAA